MGLAPNMGPLRDQPILWMDETLHHFEAMVETIFWLVSTGESLGAKWISPIHSRAGSDSWSSPYLRPPPLRRPWHTSPGTPAGSPDG